MRTVKRKVKLVDGTTVELAYQDDGELKGDDLAAELNRHFAFNARLVELIREGRIAK